MSAFAVRGLFVVAVVELAALTHPARADTVAIEVPVVMPYRPSVSTPAAFSAPGWLETEVGVLREKVENRNAARPTN